MMNPTTALGSQLSSPMAVGPISPHVSLHHFSESQPTPFHFGQNDKHEQTTRRSTGVSSGTRLEHAPSIVSSVSLRCDGNKAHLAI